ncbi:autotransporter domain-containing protein [Pseudomonas songnenensis]|uniref:Autotransporter domain-containing protein n=1 Tax=Pseudomonas songnenensis TaxID=1176259 RepID=A0ABX9UXH4_9PSED|nr:autotransporter domain-containing SGNH/GDSL hydrolase family protein [Pseudomonas songnenensis]MCQ4300422.1 autotransporter domain-containing protein [Pseudomonas songnenensis]RMH97699.1 autotransporter domain-containing protein [Pseudomonas songnenensis]
MQSALKPLAAVILLTCAAGTATANSGPFSQFVVFGDSLSDAGTFPDMLSPTFDALRFTNRIGPTYGPGEAYAEVGTQQLASLLGLQSNPATPLVRPDTGGTNYAVGGYRTDEILNSITSSSDPGAGPRPGYLARYTRADANALYYLNGGGNDIFQGRDMVAAARDLAAGVGALQAAGARYIIVSDLPDVGTTPLGAFSGQTAAFNLLSDQFNAELASRLQAQGGNYVLVNNRLLLSEVRADLAAFGFAPNVAQTAVCFDSSSSTPCLPDPTYGLGGIAPDPSRLMFNDGVHPTTAVHQISADYLYSIISAPWEVSLLPEMGRSALRAHLQQLDNELSAQRGNWQAVGAWRTFVQGGYNRPEYDGYGGGDGHGLSLSVGVTQRLSEAWLAGVSLGLAENSLELGRNDSDYDMRSYLATAFARYEYQRLFADFSLSAGYLDYHDLKRTFALGITERAEKGDTEGTLWGAAAKAGFNLMQPGDQLQFGPFIGASYQKVDVDGYSEKGARSTALSYHDQELKSLRLSLGLFGEYALTDRTRLFGEVAREVEREDEDRQDLRMSLNSVPDNSFELPGAMPTGDQTRFSLGLAHRLSPGLSLRANYNYRGNDNRDHGLGLSLAWDL